MKNIVLLSDGTGNGAAKKNKTNVWRLYDALNLHDKRQIAMYDDGVGSKDSTVDKVLGGAFGIGLQRNVIELYKYLCRNYRTAKQNKSNDDKIFLFGFSRGAFTVRVLAGFVVYSGLYTNYTDEEDLHEQALSLYGHYRDRYRHGYLTKLFKKIFNGRSTLKETLKPRIEFIGVWDTVDAYVFPIDELAKIWDCLIYPIRFPDYQLDKENVKQACHAISVDDERHTFHPVMWDESQETSDRIKQVWFSGVHADIGGGYARRSLALVTLDWMMTQVEATDKKSADVNKGLVFIKSIRDEYKDRSDWNGPQHDSRSGLAAYYRYKPRDIFRICNDEKTGVKIIKPKIHRSVFERIKGRALPYAPTQIPAVYEVAVTEGNMKSYENQKEAENRSSALNHALDVILWRRVLYFALLLATFALVLSRFFLDKYEGGICVDSACVIDPVIQLINDSLPEPAVGWLEALQQNPPWMWGFIVLFIVLFKLRRSAWLATRKHAMSAWVKVRDRSEAIPAWNGSLISKLRVVWNNGLGKAVSWLFAVVLFLVILYVLFSVINSSVFHVRNSLGSLCTSSADAVALMQERKVSLNIGRSCYGTGFILQAGKTYHLTVSDSIVHDGTSAATADGLINVNPRMYLFIPLRRHVTEPWIQLFGRIGEAGNDNFVLAVGENQYKAQSDGELFLYVNDAVFGVLPQWDLPYTWAKGKNTGEITVIMKMME